MVKSLISISVGINTISVDEVLALRDALWTVKMKGYANVDVKGDSKLVIDAITRISTTPWGLKNIIKNIEWLANSFDSIS